MTFWQQIIVFVYGLVNFGLFLKGLYESNKKNNAFGLTRRYSCFGMFVWGDAVVFGIFWAIASLISLILNDWYLFLLIISVFWLVRSIGETIYWFLQQFATVKRDQPHTLNFYKIFHNESVWFVHQIIWQCVTVASLITTVYLFAKWLQRVL